MKKILCFLLLILCLGHTGVAQTGEEIFLKNCLACHTIGEGRKVGPDLKGVETRRSMEWIESFILNSEKLIASGDEQAIANFEEYNKIKMQNFDFNPGQLTELITYIIKAGGGEVPAPVAPEVPLTQEEKAVLIPVGKKLFTGEQSFIEGGLSCFACHHVSYEGLKPGGSLGTDLTAAFTKYNGMAGLKGFITTPSSAIMEMEYHTRPLSKEEIASIAAFLEDANNSSTPKSDSTMLFIGGIILACMIAFLIMIIWSEKKKHNVNEAILKRQLRVKMS